VLLSGDHTWLERGDLTGEVEFNPLQERRGPLTLGLGLERQPDDRDGPQRVLVVGDGDFLSNTYIGNSGNLELGLRMINWLASDDTMITIPPRTVEDARLNMPQVLLGVFGITLLLALPLGLLENAELAMERRLLFSVLLLLLVALLAVSVFLSESDPAGTEAVLPGRTDPRGISSIVIERPGEPDIRFRRQQTH